jgi:predicted TIM-barrel fold metal-dependent hydrolase
MYAGFTPNQPELNHFWQYATRHNLPVLLHTERLSSDKHRWSGQCQDTWMMGTLASHVKIILAHLSI